MKPADRQPAGKLTLYGGVFVKEMLTPDAGTIIPQHAHRYDHVSYLAAGAVRLWKDGEYVGEFDAPAAIRIPALAKHRFETICDWTLILCIHAVGEAEDVDIHEEHHLAEMEG